MMEKTSARSRNRIWMTVFAAVLLVCVTVSFLLGKYPVSPGELCGVLLSRIFPVQQTWEPQAETIILQVRMPRIFAAVLIGAALSGAGACYQGIFRNPMVSPDVLGASAASGFGAALALFASLSYFAISMSSFLFGLVSVLLVYLVGRNLRSNPVLGLVLTGIMVSSLFSSATSFIKLVADPTNVLPAITYWLMGSLASIRQQDLLFAGVPIIIGLIPMLLLGWKFNVLTMGEEEARTMGVNTKAVRLAVIFCATLVTAASVSVSGMIGWVGLVIPHFARMIFGSDHRVMLPASMLMGASFLLIVDDFARLITTSEIPLGILTAFVGAPFFVYLILREGRKA